jgi:hypothetical protein
MSGFPVRRHPSHFSAPSFHSARRSLPPKRHRIIVAIDPGPGRTRLAFARTLGVSVRSNVPFPACPPFLASLTTQPHLDGGVDFPLAVTVQHGQRAAYYAADST